MVDSVGNRLGPRGYYDYETDDGEIITVQLDASVADAVGNTKSTAANKKQSFKGSSITPRYMILQLVDNPNVKKKVVLTDPDSGFMTNATSASIAINDQNWSQTFRSGEKRSMVPAQLPDEPAT